MTVSSPPVVASFSTVLQLRSPESGLASPPSLCCVCVCGAAACSVESVLIAPYPYRFPVRVLACRTPRNSYTQGTQATHLPPPPPQHQPSNPDVFSNFFNRRSAIIPSIHPPTLPPPSLCIHHPHPLDICSSHRTIAQTSCECGSSTHLHRSSSRL